MKDLTAEIEALTPCTMSCDEIAAYHVHGLHMASCLAGLRAPLLALFAEAQGQIDDAAVARGVKVFAQFGIGRHGSTDIVRAILLAALIPTPPKEPR